ncbi:hypothetical protein SAY86_006626 [Trapa natans]|uniref:Uncharacterized protein n=1 Tax=Trapa natans TaxID=22666 RepID=A0AAN7KZ66_TRANT|nr:hypothetical protein SAY86_006626 [Trapa natans]
MGFFTTSCLLTKISSGIMHARGDLPCFRSHGMNGWLASGIELLQQASNICKCHALHYTSIKKNCTHLCMHRYMRPLQEGSTSAVDYPLSADHHEGVIAWDSLEM